MPAADDALHQLSEMNGVEGALLAGEDGLLIREAGSLDQPEQVAARVPDALRGVRELARAGGRNEVYTLVAETDRGSLIATAVDEGVLLGVLVRPGVDFSPVLREIRRGGARLAAGL